MGNTDGLSIKDLWEVGIHIGPILLGLVIATYKILRVIDEKMGEHVKPMVDALNGVEYRLTQGIEAIWKHEEKQDARLDDIFKQHYTLMGRHNLRCPARKGDAPHDKDQDGDGGD